MTLIRNIKCFTNKTALKIVPCVVHFTSDNFGETLSLQAQGIQITVSYEDIEKIVERERKKRYTWGYDIVDEGWGHEA